MPLSEVTSKRAERLVQEWQAALQLLQLLLLGQALQPAQQGTQDLLLLLQHKA